MAENINYTIIIPHKNIPKLLQQCIDSVPERNDIQIIVVDDNSDPTIVDFDNFPGNTRANVEIHLTKEGKGAGYARNVALKHAKGKWILFADADDKFNQHFINILDEYIDSVHDIIYFGVNGYNIKDMSPSYRNYIYDEILEKAIEKNDLNYYYYYIYQPWGKLFSMELIRRYSLTFDEIPVGNDRMFSIKCITNSTSTTYDKRKIYTSFNRSDSLTTLKDINSEIIRLDLDCRVNKYLKEYGKFQYRINIFITYIRAILRSNPSMTWKGFRTIYKYGKIYTITDFFSCIKHAITIIRKK